MGVRIEHNDRHEPEDAVELARRIRAASEEELPSLITHWRNTKTLCNRVHLLNKLLAGEEHHLALSALRRLGLEYGG